MGAGWPGQTRASGTTAAAPVTQTGLKGRHWPRLAQGAERHPEGRPAEPRRGRDRPTASDDGGGENHFSPTKEPVLPANMVPPFPSNVP